nr:PREDICTED: indoleamine 2,3-dioxygenase 2-like [Apteryx mantelli mantelli]
MASSSENEETPLPFTLSRFQVSEDYGFLLPNPLMELPAPYGPWMEIASSLPQLIASRQLRSRLHQVPSRIPGVLGLKSTESCKHLVLSFLTMGYLWQEGEEGTVKVLPRNLAVPFWEVSQRLGLPPILSHADFVLANWKRKTPGGPLEIENLDPIISLPGGESLRGFILVTLLVEKAAVPGIKAIAQAINALLQLDEETLHKALQHLAGAVGDMSKALRRMHDYVDPAVFYSVIRIFLSGLVPAQKQPCLRERNHCCPWLNKTKFSLLRARHAHGYGAERGPFPQVLLSKPGRGAVERLGEEQRAVVTRGKEPDRGTLQRLARGLRRCPGSRLAAPRERVRLLWTQTDFLLCCSFAAAFLHRMRDYMPPPHRAFVEEIQRAPSLRQHVLSSRNGKLCAAFNQCVSALTDFRTHHIAIVTKYITTAAAKAKAGRGEPADGAGPPPGKPPSLLEAKGTGGSHIFRFLKSVRDTTREGMISA